MNIIMFLHIEELLLLALFSALIGFAFNKMMEPDMVFNWYKDLLIEFCWIKNPKYPMDSDANILKLSKFRVYLTKPLGLCIVCNTIWIGIILSLIIIPIPVISRIVLSILTGCASGGIVILIENLFKRLQR